MKKVQHLSEKAIIFFQIIFFAILLFMSSMMLQGCEDKCETVTSYLVMEPVYLTTDSIRNAFRIEDPHPIETSGKIYIFGDYLLVNEPSKGIHIIENKDCNPTPHHFIAIPGNFDMAVKDFVLYADSYIDLLAIDISNLPQISLMKRVENAFPFYNSVWGYDPGQENLIIAHWQEREIVDIQNDCRNNGGVFFEGDVLFMRADASASQKVAYTTAANGSGVTGIGGSMARFAIKDNYLYAVDNNTLRVFDILKTNEPVPGNSVDIGWGIETIFPYKDHLFIGSNSGMYIFDNTDPTNPVLKSEFQHVRTCDPVVVDDQYAYVTLRSGNECQGFTNQLDVLDITDLFNPTLVKSYPMDNPHGLSIDGDLLFITEGEFGMKLFDATDITDIGNHLLDKVANVHGYDVIAFDQRAIMIGDDGLYI